MKHEMPAMTDEQHEMVLKYLNMHKEPRADHFTALDRFDCVILIEKIALAALTAEPVGYLRMNDSDWDFNGHNEFSGGGRGIAVYTAPPVPVLRPIVLPKRKSMLTRENFDEDYVTCMAVPLDDVISAIRAAGYEVKDE